MYRAIIDVRIEVQEEKDGKMTGHIIPESEMNQKKLSNNILLVITGATKNDCLTKLQEWVKNAK